MSIGGPSALGTLLVHRLDSVLGTTLSQQANVVSGARPDAVTQPGSPDRIDALQNETQRQTRDGVNRATAQTGQHGKDAIDRARIDARAAEILAARSAPNTSTTQSAPTSLGHAARTILALLANFPEQAAAIQGKAPLLVANPRGGNAGTAVTAGGGNPAATTATANAARADATAGLHRAPGGAPPSTSTAAGQLNAAGATTAAGQTAASVPAQLAQALAHALQRSGMFYESHLHNLAFGKQTLAQLQQEPQAQAGRGSPEGAASGSGKNTATTGTAQQPANTAGQPGAGSASATATQGHRGDAAATSQGAPASTGANTSVPVPGLDPQTHQLVRQQLEVLANQSFSWRGEAWPNAPMEWEVNRREPTWEDTDLSPETEQWATRINIQLPVLGNVQARLTLAGQQLVMHLIAPESSTLLKEHTEGLRDRYSAMGMQLSQLSVSSNAWEAAGGGQKIPDNPTAAYYQQHENANEVSGA